MISDGVMALQRAGKVTNHRKGLLRRLSRSRTFALGGAELYALARRQRRRAHAPGLRGERPGAAPPAPPLRQHQRRARHRPPGPGRGRPHRRHASTPAWAAPSRSSWARPRRRAGRACCASARPPRSRDGGSPPSCRGWVADACVTTPRHHVQWVVTEHGAADLSVLGDLERARALIGARPSRLPRRAGTSRPVPADSTRMSTATIGSLELYYEEHGSGEPLLLIMGLAADSTAWMFQVPEFAAALPHDRLRQPRRRAEREAGRARTPSTRWRTTRPGCSTSCDVRARARGRRVDGRHDRAGAGAAASGARARPGARRARIPSPTPTSSATGASRSQQFGGSVSAGGEMQIDVKAINPMDFLQHLLPMVFNQEFIANELPKLHPGVLRRAPVRLQHGGDPRPGRRR